MAVGVGGYTGGWVLGGEAGVGGVAPANGRRGGVAAPTKGNGRE